MPKTGNASGHSTLCALHVWSTKVTCPMSMVHNGVLMLTTSCGQELYWRVSVEWSLAPAWSLPPVGCRGSSRRWSWRHWHSWGCCIPAVVRSRPAPGREDCWGLLRRLSVLPSATTTHSTQSNVVTAKSQNLQCTVLDREKVPTAAKL